MLPKLSELHAKCRDLGLLTYENVEYVLGQRQAPLTNPGKADYVALLREHYMPPEGLPYAYVEPMKAFQITKLKPEQQAELWVDNNDWVAQRKINGIRAFCHFVKDVGVFVHTQTISVKTFRYTDISDRFLFLDYVPNFSAILDCEALVDAPITLETMNKPSQSSLHSTKTLITLSGELSRKRQQKNNTPIKLHAFDILSRDDVEVMDWDYAVRRDMLQKILERTHKAGLYDFFTIPTVVKRDKKAFLSDVIKRGGEGVILKNMNEPYVQGSRSRTRWVKAKKGLEFDMFVTGFKRGEPGNAHEDQVGAIIFSMLNEHNEEVEMAVCSHLTEDFRASITIYHEDIDEVGLEPWMYFRVAEISGQEISGRNQKLSHAKLERWREGPDEKLPELCIISTKELEQLSKWSGG